MSLTTCVKIGGSLLNNPPLLRACLSVITRFAGRVVLVNGSGPLRSAYDYKRGNELLLQEDMEVALLELVRATAAVLLTGFDSSIRLARTFVEINALADKRLVPVADPATLLATLSDPRSGAEMVAARLCKLLDIGELLVLTNIDGVLASDPNGDLLPRLSTHELEGMGTTCLDRRLAPLLRAHNLRCVILNGWHPDRVEVFLRTGMVSIGTIVEDRAV